MSEKFRKIFLLVSVVITLSLLVYGCVAGFKASQVRGRIGSKLAEVEAAYPVAFDSVMLEAKEQKYLQQLNDTITLYLQLYRQQFDIMQGTAQKPALNSAMASADWESHQNARLLSLQKSTLVLVNFVQNYGIKKGRAAYQMIDSADKKAAREALNTKKAVASRLFRNTEYLATDMQYLDFMLKVRAMMGQACGGQ